MEQPQTKEYYSTNEVAALLGVNCQTVREWARKGQIDAVQIGKQWFFPKSQFKQSVKIVCAVCPNEITGFEDELSLKEGHISGMCQSCQNKTFGDKE